MPILFSKNLTMFFYNAQCSTRNAQLLLIVVNCALSVEHCALFYAVTRLTSQMRASGGQKGESECWIVVISTTLVLNTNISIRL